jgi:hypothetical protein
LNGNGRFLKEPLSWMVQLLNTLVVINIWIYKAIHHSEFTYEIYKTTHHSEFTFVIYKTHHSEFTFVIYKTIHHSYAGVNSEWCVVLYITHVNWEWCIALYITHVNSEWCVVLYITHVNWEWCIRESSSCYKINCTKHLVTTAVWMLILTKQK